MKFRRTPRHVYCKYPPPLLGARHAGHILMVPLKKKSLLKLSESHNRLRMSAEI